MNEGDVICMPLMTNGDPATTRLYRAKALSIRGENFVLEFIEGPIDGQRLEISRVELDQIMEREGGDEWKSES